MALAPTLQRPLDQRLSPEQFALVCATNPHAVLEPAAATPVRQGPAPEDGGMHRQLHQDQKKNFTPISIPF